MGILRSAKNTKILPLFVSPLFLEINEVFISAANNFFSYYDYGKMNIIISIFNSPNFNSRIIVSVSLLY